MDDLLERILVSDDPSDLMREAVSQGPILRQMSQHIFSSVFSSYVADHPARWTAQAAETALQLLSEEDGNQYARGWLLEIAFHGNLALSGAQSFYQNLIRIEEALRCFEQQGLSRSSQYVKGLIAYARDDLVAAERAFSTLPGLIDAPLLSYQAGYAAFRAPGFHRTLANYDPPMGLSFIQEPRCSSDTSTVLLCSADELYFAAFADEFAEQVFKASPTAHIHFHLINTVEPSRLTQRNLMANDRITVTVEQTDLPDPGAHAIMARYIILPLLMQQLRKPVLVTDIDMLIRSDPATLKVEDSVTLGFCRIPAAAHIPVTAIIGHHNLFQPTDAGLAFAQFLSRYLHYMCANQLALWTADQVALLMVWRMFRNVIPIGSFRDCHYYSYGSPPDRPLKKKAAEDRLKDLAL